MSYQRSHSNLTVLRKVRQKTNDGYYVNSFERFGDDLCEVLLNFLPISEKIRFECVSKQWKRLVFNRQRKLIIGFLRRKVLYEELKPEPDLQIEIRYSNRVKRICPQMSFRKFGFIRELTIDDMLSARLQNIISNDFIYLEKLILLSGVNTVLAKDLTANYWQRLKSIELRETNIEYLREFPQFVSKITTIFCEDMYYNHSKEYYLPKLEEILIEKVEQFKEIQLFCSLYFEHIRKLEITFGPQFVPINESLKCLSKFTKLETLIMKINKRKEHISPIDTGLLMIGKNCTQLKHFKILSGSYPFNGDLFFIFGQFRSLVKLDIELYTRINYGRLESMKNCRHLKCLLLNNPKDENLSDIHLFLPNLLRLDLYGNNYTDQIFEDLSELEYLTALSLNTECMSDDKVCQFIKRSKSLRNLYLRRILSDSIINVFIDRALKNPKTYYILSIRVDKVESNKDNKEMNLKNLLIEKRCL